LITTDSSKVKKSGKKLTPYTSPCHSLLWS